MCNTVISENSKLRVNLNFDSFPENEEQLSVFGNEQLLMIALKNIIDNACKFSGSKPIRVELKSDDENVKIQISDQGIGIPEEDIENIFQPFYRGKNANYTAGYGIGLALTSKIIELHNGKISVESEVSKGSMFTTVLPNRLHF